MTVVGSVNARREAVAPLRVCGAAGSETVVIAVVDTGYSGAMALPESLCMTLGLTRLASVRTTLADGSSRRLASYEAAISWDGGWKPVAVTAVGSEALVGMRLLLDHELRVEVVVGGSVTVQPLAAPEVA